MAVIRLWLTQEAVAPVPSATRLQRSDHLGRTEFGHVYISLSDRALEAWPNAGEKIAEALGIE